MKLRASVSVIALVTISILLLIGVGITNMIHFSMTSSARDFEVTRGRWFLEGRVEEYFDALLDGKRELRPNKLVFREKIDGRDQEYRFEIGTKDRVYTFHATMRWKERYTIEQYVEFRRKNAFEYAFLLNGNTDVELSRDMMFSGRVGMTGDFKVVGRNGQAVWADGRTTFEYADAEPGFDPQYYNIPVQEFIRNPNGVYNISRIDAPATPIRKDESLLEMKLPPFESVWKTYSAYADPSWIIDDATMLDRKSLLNALSSEKELIAFGDGFTTRFPTDGQEIRNVYLMQTSSDRRFQEVPSLDYLYFRGPEDRSVFFQAKGRELRLIASQTAVPMNMPEQSLNMLGWFGFKGSYYSYLSKDEGIADLEFEEPNGKHRLMPNLDYTFSRQQNAVQILSSSFLRRHTLLLGKGDGVKLNFPFQSLGRIMYIFVDGVRNTSYSLDRNTVAFSTPPDTGAEVRAFFDPPRVFVRKAPPGPNVGIFVDKVDDCVILNLDQIQNHPSRGVIMSSEPLLIKGSTRLPLAIICSENVYIEDLNPSDDSAPVLIASAKGVWVYRRQDKTDNKINKCFLYSPLSGLYTVLSTGELQNPPLHFYGSAVFTGERKNGVMIANGTYEKNFFYWDGARDWLYREPFVNFPFPIDVLRVRRN